MAANAAIHSKCAAPGSTITVTVTICPGEHVRIEVRDDGGSWIPSVTDTERPHGLDLIRAFATCWGVTGTDAGRIVWAQLDWPES